MQEYAPTSKPLCLRDDALAVLRKLRAEGFEAYFAGGCVRDELLGLTPTDFDIATSAPPKKVRELFPKTQAVGQAFGVILVRQQRSVVEVATFRTEFDYQDGRRPSHVRFATAEEDAQRRDFTINGLFIDPIDGRVIDFVGGREDLKAGRLRAIGEPGHRFSEDHLRLLRGVRFAARFGLTIEGKTAEAIRVHAPLLKRISPERIADELRRMLTVPSRNSAWRMLWGFALIDTICRFLPSGEGVDFSELRCPFLHLSNVPEISFGLALAAGALCYRCHANSASSDIRPMLEHVEVTRIVRAMRQALRISNEESERLHATLEGAGMMLQEPLRPAKYKRFLARQSNVDSRLLLESLAEIGQHRQHIRQTVLPQLDALDGTIVAPEPLITGDDLKELGMKPGPTFRRILEAVYDAQLEGAIADRVAALALAGQLDRA